MPSYGKQVPGVDDPRLLAGIKLLERTGIGEFQIRFDDEQAPIVWVAVVGYRIHNHKISSSGKINAYKAGCGAAPLEAVMDLCDKALSGGLCTHCERHTMFDENFGQAPLDEYFCWYQWDPEVQTFRRGCEGDA